MGNAEKDVLALGRMLAQALENNSPEAPASPIARSRVTSEILRLPPDVIRVVAAFLEAQCPGMFQFSFSKHVFLNLEAEDGIYRGDDYFVTLDSLHCTDPILGDLLAGGTDVLPGQYYRVKDPLGRFISIQFKRGINLTTDEHYLERRFLAETFLKVFPPEALDRLEPQAPFVGTDGRSRRIDFVLRGKKHYAIELEGREYHDEGLIGRRRFADEKQRQRDLESAGFSYLPYSFDEVVSGSAVDDLRERCKQDHELRRLINQSRAAAPGNEEYSPYRTALYFARTFPALFRQMQYMLLDEMVEAAVNGTSVRLVDGSFAYGLGAMAAADLWTLAERCILLYGLEVSLPQISVETSVAPEESNSATAIATFYQNTDVFSDGGDRRLDAHESGKVLHLLGQPGSVRDAITLGDTLLEMADLAERATKARIKASKWPAVSPKVALPREPSGAIAFEQAEPTKRVADYFARRFFRIPALRRPQYETILRAFGGEPSLVLLATGGGKSICYQLAAMLMPGLTIVVSPLKALIRDQLWALGSVGLSSVAGTSSDDSSTERESLMQQLGAGTVRLLYVSPERLLIKGFLDEFTRSSAAWNVQMVAIDEAHCVSEWGHDFRPAYLSVPRFFEWVERSQGRAPVLLALTATASRLVRQDILSTLGIPESGLITYGSVDRPELSLSVHAVGESKTNGAQGRLDVVTDLLERGVPQSLGFAPGGLAASDDIGLAKHGSVIFALFANPHGKHTIELGVPEIAQRLREAEIAPPSAIRIHASTEVTVCPIPGCASHRFWFSDGDRICEHGHQFTHSDEKTMFENWPDVMRRHQDGFKDNEFPFLVATKSYGMGIDKRNIRAIVHTSFPSGIESLYQEIGRAGRDQKHAHAALVYRPATAECVQNLAAPILDDLYGTIVGEPPCVSEARNYRFWKCPYGLTSLCDYGLQARFIQASYPGVEDDVDTACKSLSRILAGTQTTARLGPYRGDVLARQELALYRLQQIGLAGDYQLEYQGQERAIIHVDIPRHTDFVTARQQLWAAIQKLDWQQKGRRTWGEIEGLSPEPRAGDAHPAIGDARPLLRVLISETYFTIKSMRYLMLDGLRKYAATVAPDCRREVLRRRIEDVETGWAETSACEFCDICIPDLRFKRDRAVVPAADMGLSEVAARLPHALERLDPEELENIFLAVVEHNALAGLQAKAEHHLESEPSSISARLLAGRAAAQRANSAEEDRREDFRRQALQHFLPALQEAELTRLGLETSETIYDQIAAIDAKLAIDATDYVARSFDSPRGHERLLRDASSVVDQGRTRILAAHVALDMVTEAAAQMNYRLISGIRRL